MIKSMTGFGRCERSNQMRKICVEIKSLNSKQLDLNVRIPSIYRNWEAQIRSKVAAVAVRGKIDFAISFQNISTIESGVINAELFKTYYSEIKNLIDQVGGDGKLESISASVLKMPDVVCAVQVEIDESEWKLVEEAIDEALIRYDQFRSIEGKVLMEDLVERINIIERLSSQIPQYEAERIETVRNRMKENLQKLNVDIDSSRFEQEVVYYLEKLDITEEKVRLKQHLTYFKEVAAQPEAGRKLGFIIQEIGREINTTGSKANHIEIQKLVVGMKDELEKIKEQLLNIM